jgi:hypothetical protein
LKSRVKNTALAPKAVTSQATDAAIVACIIGLRFRKYAGISV